MAVVVSHSGLFEYYSKEQCLDPRIRSFAWRSIPEAWPRSLPPARHLKYLEINYIVSGLVQWWCEQDVYAARGGQVLIIRPNEMHGGVDDVLNPCEIYYTNIRLDATGEGIVEQEMRRIAREFKAIPSRCFDGSPEIHNAITQLAREFRQPDEHSKARVAALLMDLLVSILRAAAKSSSGPLITKSTGIQQAIDYIEKHLADPEDTSRLAAEVGMKRDSFREKFQHEVGMTPAEYLLRRRIQKVQDLLRENKLSTTDIAQSVGFSSSQYLATAFKKIMAITPQAYRQRHLTSSNHQIR